jgi:phospholipase C
MGYWADYTLREDDAEVTFAARDRTWERLPPGQVLELAVSVVAGPIDMYVAATEIAADQNPTVPTRGPGESTNDWLDRLLDGLRKPLSLRVDLFAPGAAQPAFTWRSPGPQVFIPASTWAHRGYTPAADALMVPGLWRCRVTNDTTKTASCALEVGHWFARSAPRRRDVPMRVLNHAVAVALQALAPSLTFRGDAAILAFGADLKELVGPDRASLLADRTIDLPRITSADGKMLSATIAVGAGTEVLAVVDQQYAADRKKVLAIFGPGSGAVRALDAKNQEWHAAVVADDPALLITAYFSAFDFEYEKAYVDWDVHLDAFQINLYWAFDKKLERGRVAMTSTAEFSDEPLIDVAEYFGLDGASTKLAGPIVPALEEVSPLIGRYLGELLVQAIEPEKVFLDVRVAARHWSVRYVAPPITGDRGLGASPIVAPGPRPLLPRPGPLRPPVPTLPFDSGDPTAAGRLDRIETVVVLMLENRSYDHLFGYLRERYGPAYDGMDAAMPFTNPSAPPLVNPVAAIHHANTRIPVSPHHGYTHVMRQIARGAMTGFAADLADRGDQYYAMSYYTDSELPVYDELSRSYVVCDRWFAAHPGPTFPNRFATVMGSIPELENLEISDPRLGWIPNGTIFDVLSENGIAWRYFESDVAFLRMFDAYRLDDTHVVPFDDPIDGFRAYLNSGAVHEPRVIFIDPNFADVPPASTANDDHPPADLRRGQRLVCDIYNTLIASPRWQNTLFVVTYDEHGGFYDHVPPLGTDLGPPAWKGAVPPLHPDGPHHVGVRVPTLVISPWVSAAVASPLEFDHTSLMKTILLRFRDTIPAAALGQFGSRVNTALSLAPLLNDDPRTIVPATCAYPWPVNLARRSQVPRAIVSTTPDGLDPLVATPAAGIDRRLRKVRRLLTEAARIAEVLEVDPGALDQRAAAQAHDPDDFHVAVRQLYRPRRR